MREVRKFELLQYRAEIRRVRVQLHDGDAVGGAERGQATQQHQGLALFDIAARSALRACRNTPATSAVARRTGERI